MFGCISCCFRQKRKHIQKDNYWTTFYVKHASREFTRTFYHQDGRRYRKILPHLTVIDEQTCLELSYVGNMFQFCRTGYYFDVHIVKNVAVSAHRGRKPRKTLLKEHLAPPICDFILAYAAVLPSFSK
jgi:hypothetical protein